MAKQIPNPISYFLGKRLGSYQSEVSGKLEVWSHRGKKILYSSNATQSFDTLHELFQKIFPQIGLPQNPPQKVLLLGLGGGSVVTILRDELLLNAPIDAIELDPVIIEIAHKHYNIDRYKNLKITQADAYDYVQKPISTGYDLVVADLFADNLVPPQFFDEVFNTALINLLSPSGQLVFNIMVENKDYEARLKNLMAFYKGQTSVQLRLLTPLPYNNVLVVNKV